MGICDEKKVTRKKRKPRPKRAKLELGRYRVKQELDDSPWVMNHVQAFPSPLPEPRTESRITFREVMVDDTGRIELWQNPCWHQRYMEEAGYILRPRNPRSLVDLSIVADSAPLPDFYQKLTTGIPPIPSEVMESLRDRALSHFREQVAPEALLMASILEIVTAIKLGESIAKKGAKLQDETARRYYTKKKSLIRKGVEDQLAGYIAWKFVVLPVLMDLKAFWCSFEKAVKRLNFLTKHRGSPVRVRYAYKNFLKDIDPADLTIWAGKPGGYYYGNWNPACPPWVGGCASPEREEIAGNYFIFNEKFQVDFHAQAMVVYPLPDLFRTLMNQRFPDIPGLTREHSLTLYAMWGLDRPGSTVWELIPFSFVADWFTDIGKQVADWIDDVAKIWPDGEIRQVGHSIKLTSRWSVAYDIDDEPEFGEHLGFIDYKVYNRCDGLPPGSSYSWDNGGAIRYDRSILSAALVAGFTKNWHYRHYYKLPRRVRR